MHLNKANQVVLLAKHQPLYEPEASAHYQGVLKHAYPLVSEAEINNLQALLSNLEKNNGFILQLGECAELFVQANKKDILARVNFMASLSAQITNRTAVTIGRIAGQYAKPRSNDTIDNPQYKGDIAHSINSMHIVDPSRLINAYDASSHSIQLIKECSLTYAKSLFISHEALVMAYEVPLTRLLNSKYYNTSAHTVWLGERTSYLGSAHIDYLANINNPLGIKISANTVPKDLINILSQLNPANIPGKIMLIARFGLANIHKLQNIINVIITHKANVLWMVDPMHGNTYTTKHGLKTRSFNVIKQEVQAFIDILKTNKLYFAGLHIENTPDPVTECVDEAINEQALSQNYLSLCDPRLNYEQSTELLNYINKALK